MEGLERPGPKINWPSPILILLRERDRELWERKRNRGMCKCIAAKAAFRNVIGWREREKRKDGSVPTFFRKNLHQPRGTILVRSKLCILFLGWFPLVPFGSLWFLFLFYLARGRKREGRKREGERLSHRRQGSGGFDRPYGFGSQRFPNRGRGADGLSDLIDR